LVDDDAAAVHADILKQHLDHGVDVALRARELGRVFHLDKNDEEEIVPHVVLVFAVLLK